MLKEKMRQWVIYFGVGIITLIIICMLMCNTNKNNADKSRQESSHSTKKIVCDSKPNDKERIKTPDELYEDRYRQSSGINSTPFLGDEVVPPKLLQLEQEAANAEQPYVEQDSNIVPYDLQELEKNSSNSSNVIIKKYSKIIPQNLLEMEKKTDKYQKQTIQKDTNIVSKKLQRVEQKPITKMEQSHRTPLKSNVLPEELKVLENAN